MEEDIEEVETEELCQTPEQLKYEPADTVDAGIASHDKEHLVTDIEKEEKGEKIKPEYEIVEKLKGCAVMDGDSASFNVVLNELCDNVQWFISETEINPSDSLYELTSYDTKYSLKILKCILKDNRRSIKFVCDENVSCSAKLTVQPMKPSVKEKTTLVQECATGDSVPLGVEIKGHVNPSIEWFKGLKRILNNPRKTLIENEDGESTLTLVNVSTADTGFYKIVVKSKSGTSDLKFNVKIKGKNHLHLIHTTKKV